MAEINKMADDTPKDHKLRTFVARQPIFDVNQTIFGYELLFRNGLENFFDESLDKDYASSKVVLDSFLLFDLNELTGGKRAFLNFTSKVLLHEAATAFPTESIVVELLETIQPEPQIVDVCKKLKRMGYTIALDDFEYEPRYQPLIDLTDIIKVDMMLTPEEKRNLMLETIGHKKVKFLAEKVETKEEFDKAVKQGYSYFQGYYFSKPQIVQKKDVHPYKINLLQILKEMQMPNVKISRLERTIARDVSLSYKLLRFINSAAFGLVREIRSIRHALNLMGILEFKKWMSLILLSQMGSDKPNELLINSLIRAKFCELTAANIALKSQESDFFLMGLLSLIDAFLDRPLDEILNELPISSEIKAAILGGDSKLGRVLRLMIYYERSKWDAVSEASKELKLDEPQVLENYFTSIKWANDFSGSAH